MIVIFSNHNSWYTWHESITLWAITMTIFFLGVNARQWKIVPVCVTWKSLVSCWRKSTQQQVHIHIMHCTVSAHVCIQLQTHTHTHVDVIVMLLWISQCYRVAAVRVWVFPVQSLMKHLWQFHLHWRRVIKLQWVVKQEVCVTVLGRNWTLFHCVFWPYYCIQITVTLNSC